MNELYWLLNAIYYAIERMQRMSKVGQTVSIMNIDFLNITKTNFLEDYLYLHLQQQQKSFVVTANPEIVMKAREDVAYKEMIQSADYIVPDGAGVLLAAKLMKQPLQERIAGFDLMMDLLAFANEKHLSCYFLGAEPDVSDQVVREAEKRFPHLKIAGHQHGFFTDEEKVSKTIRASNPDIILVALGFPRQEEWITKHINHFDKGLFIGVGGSFDVLSGKVKRAPDKWIKYNLEWLYRILQQPFRIKRIFKVFEFIMRIMLKRK